MFVCKDVAQLRFFALRCPRNCSLQQEQMAQLSESKKAGLYRSALPVTLSVLTFSIIELNIKVSLLFPRKTMPDIPTNSDQATDRKKRLQIRTNGKARDGPLTRVLTPRNAGPSKKRSEISPCGVPVNTSKTSIPGHNVARSDTREQRLEKKKARCGEGELLRGKAECMGTEDIEMLDAFSPSGDKPTTVPPVDLSDIATPSLKVTSPSSKVPAQLDGTSILKNTEGTNDTNPRSIPVISAKEIAVDNTAANDFKGGEKKSNTGKNTTDLAALATKSVDMAGNLKGGINLTKSVKANSKKTKLKDSTNTINNNGSSAKRVAAKTSKKASDPDDNKAVTQAAKAANEARDKAMKAKEYLIEQEHKAKKLEREASESLKRANELRVEAVNSTIATLAEKEN